MDLSNQIVKILKRLPLETKKMFEALGKRSPNAASLLFRKYSKFENIVKSGNIAAWKKFKKEEKENFNNFFQELKKSADIAAIKQKLKNLNKK